MSHRKQLFIIALLITLVSVGVLSGCGAGKISEPYKDAKRGSTNDDKADTITFPDGFSNVATKCDHGNRVYVVFKGDEKYGSIAVVPNAEGC